MSDDPGTEDNNDNSNSEILPEEITEGLPSEHIPSVKTAISRFMSISVERFQGPIPPPKLLHHYEEVAPGSANRIIAMAEAQQSHRHELEKAVIHSDIVLERWGLVFGFILAFVLLVGGIALLFADKEITGLLVLTSTVGGFVGIKANADKRRQSQLGERKRRVTPEPPPKSDPDQ